MIIGLTGSLAAGKGVVSDFLKEKGFVYLSLSDELREIAKQNKIELTRENLQNLGNHLRKKEGSGVLAKLIVNKIINQQYSKAIVDGIRNPAEIEELRKLKDFKLLSVDADKVIRFQRMIQRNRESDPITWEDFLKIDSKDKGEGEEESGQGVRKCMAQAEFFLTNNGSIEEVKKDIEELYKKLNINPRPNWDEYFMKITAVVAERSTCLRHNVGAIIVKNKRIITTGYNGAVRGAEDCLTLGCKKDELKLETGFGAEQCRAVHAEQNAISQAGLHGANTEGGTMYCTHIPCLMCAKQIINAGIKELVYYFDYAGSKGSLDFLEKHGVKIKKISRPKNIINFKD